MVNNSRSPIPQVEEKKKQYTDHDVERSDRKILFQNITGQPVNQTLYAVDDNILQNPPILREYVGMAEDIYGPSVP